MIVNAQVRLTSFVLAKAGAIGVYFCCTKMKTALGYSAVFAFNKEW